MKLPPKNNYTTHPQNSPQKTKTAVFVRAESSFEGLLPRPDHLKAYEEILPGIANRLLLLTEQTSEHKRNMDALWLKKSFSQQWGGKIFGLIVTLAGLLVCAFLTLKDHYIVGSITAVFPIATIVSIFVLGKNNKEKNN